MPARLMTGTTMPGAVGPLGSCNARGGSRGYAAAAIAVLIMAALGALMWIGFQQIWGHASTQTDNQITKISG